jgi:arsenate reductase
VKKAREWAEANGLDPQYEHFSKLPDLKDRIAEWVKTPGIDAVFNEKAQTFKKMAPEEQAGITASDAARIEAMAADPRLIKRPVGTDGKTVLTGFKQAEWEKAFL